MLRNREDALDVVQEAFTKAYQNLDRFKGESGFYTWVYRIAYNLCVDHQRREAKQPQLSLDANERGAAPPAAAGEDGPRRDHPFERARDAEIAQGVRDAIGDLTPDHRAVILLRELEGLSYAEISDVLGCPKGTVMSRLHYARRQLQARLRGLL
jgi:RNA polymerase sigma-70 factor (ECF subfamily)